MDPPLLIVRAKQRPAKMVSYLHSLNKLLTLLLVISIKISDNIVVLTYCLGWGCLSSACDVEYR